MLNIKHKSIASGTHFVASLLIFSIFVFVLFYQWYPEPYFTASGGWQGLKLVVLVDLILGPLLTFIVYNRSKTTLIKFIDYGFIISIQLSALIWGIYTVYYQRPVAIVFWEDRFYTVPDRALSIHYRNTPKYQALINEPEIPYIYAKKPGNMDELNEMMRKINDDNIPPHHQIDRYLEFNTLLPSLITLSVDIKEIISVNSKMKQALESILENSQSQLEDNVYLTLESKYQNIILVFSKTGERLGFIKAPVKE